MSASQVPSIMESISEESQDESEFSFSVIKSEAVSLKEKIEHGFDFIISFDEKNKDIKSMECMMAPEQL